MKNPLSYGIVAFVIIAFLVGFIGYTTDTRPMQTGNTTAPIQTTVPAEKNTIVKKKSCGCCAERMARRRQQIQKVRERKQAAQDAQAKGFKAQQTPERASNSP